MPWHTPDLMSQRQEFVLLARQPGAVFTRLCARYGISPKTGYKWCKRLVEGGASALMDRSRRPHTSPRRTCEQLEDQVVRLYQETTWGGRKLRRRLQDLGQVPVPAASTCTQILRRRGCLTRRDGEPHGPYKRFERAAPNALWQMDFKGHFATQAGARCHPLTVLDDHSRFNLVLEPVGDETGATVRRILRATFATYGLPEAILCDNGEPWGATEPVCPYTTLGVWLLELGVHVLHGRPYHPQTQGKDERFHKTLKRELISRHTWRDLTHCAELFPPYRHRYNCERPHDALAGDTPVQHYRPSPRNLPAALPPIDYPIGTQAHLVRAQGVITFGGQSWYVGRAFAGKPVGLRACPQSDGLWQVWFAHHQLGDIDLRTPREPKHKLRSIYPPKA
ncbi:MAG: IS481 family transposase [Opitutaceae bacterium]|nr:IS481 family transposase [Opitutaceae bacterium]